MWMDRQAFARVLRAPFVCKKRLGGVVKSGEMVKMRVVSIVEM
jgi:hypothetical protein